MSDLAVDAATGWQVLQFPPGHLSVAAVIPGALNATQVERNVAHFRQPIPAAFWTELKAEKLIRVDAPVPP